MTAPRRGAVPGAWLLLLAAAGAAGWTRPAAAFTGPLDPPARAVAGAAGWTRPAAPGARRQEAFDDPAAAAIVRRAGTLWRRPPAVAYKARAQGRVYFYLDRDDGGTPVPLRVDQVAVDVYRSDQGRSRQVVRAQRRKELLPVRDFEYYLDRLTVVQDGYAEEIRIGQGLDVRGVLHPLGRGAEQVYRYRLADSVIVRMPLADDPVRVYEIEVRPRREDQPGFVGSLFVESETGALARMEFGFTPAAYVDLRSDYVRVVLEHALWDAGYWLPYRQQIEVRREHPSLDLPFGSVIRAVLEVASYDFEPDVPPDFFGGPAVSFAPLGEADEEFDGGLMDQMAAEGLAPVRWARLESEARRIARDRLASRLPSLRLYADRFSSVLRANRSEGLRLGAGAAFAPGGTWPRLQLLAGVSGLAGQGARRPSAAARGEWRRNGRPIAAEAYARQLRDLGPRSGAPGLVNTVAVLFGRDFSDPYFAHGARAAVEFGLGQGFGGRAAAIVEKHAAAGQALRNGGLERRAFRPVRAAEEGVLTGAEAAVERSWGGRGTWGARAELQAAAGAWEGRGLGELRGKMEARAADAEMDWQFAGRLEAGAAWGAVPVQRLFFLGGAGTLPGHAFRRYAGMRFVLADMEASRAVVSGWLSVRLVAGAGAVGGAAAVDGWRLRPAGGLRAYAGAGLGLLRDLVRTDCAWGAPGGRFELVVSASPSIAAFL